MQPPTEEYLILNNSKSNLIFIIGVIGDNLQVFNKFNYYDNFGNLTGSLIINLTWFNLEPEENHLQSKNNARLFGIYKTRHLGALKKFIYIIKNFVIFDENRNIIMTSEDLREGNIIEYDYDEKGNRIIRNKQEREGNIKIEYFGKPDNYWTEVHYTIEITDELIEKGRQKYGTR